MEDMMDQLLETWLHRDPDNLKKKKPEEETLRYSVRQSEGAYRFKDIVIKRHGSYIQIVLVPNPAKKNCLSIETMKELKDAFNLAKKDHECRAVLFNSSGTYFCSGIDLSQLVGGANKKKAAEEMASAIKDLVLTLSSFMKPIIASVNGVAIGFGITLLTLCDVVLASDKATFYVPATRFGYIPEGALTYTLPQVVGSAMANEILLHGKKLTADQASKYGLVTEVLWHSNLMNEVIPRVDKIVEQHLEIMEATKIMVRCMLWQQLKPVVERESRLLPSLWLDPKCQSSIKNALETGWLND